MRIKDFQGTSESVKMDLIVRYFDDRPDEVYQYHEIDSMATQHSTKRKKRDLIFITGNKNKVMELQDNVKSKQISIEVKDLSLPEIQDNDVLNIAMDKCRSAYARLNEDMENSKDVREDGTDRQRTILIEDTCLHFSALNGMPGPYVKSFLEAIGPEGLQKMLVGFEDKSAQATCIYALMDDASKVIFCRGTVRGKIISPRGSSWGWDPVFEEERSGMTFGEMGPELKARFSHRSNAITVLRKYLTLDQTAST